jgi:restriction system protein
MSRRRASGSLIEQLAEPFAELPPVAGVIASLLLAAIGWIAPVFGGGSAIAEISLQFARWFSWLVAGLVLGYTLVGAIRRRLDRRAFDGNDDPATLTWRQFERFIAEFYRRQGGTVTLRGGRSADGGVDMTVIDAHGASRIVQCKQWRNRMVGVKPLRELWGILGDERADGAVFITSGSFSQDASEFARGKDLDLIDGPRLRTMIATVKGTGASVAAPSAGPVCPRCGSPMVLRTARRGANAGGRFWGCSTYPTCRETLPVSS